MLVSLNGDEMIEAETKCDVKMCEKMLKYVKMYEGVIMNLKNDNEIGYVVVQDQELYPVQSIIADLTDTYLDRLKALREGCEKVLNLRKDWEKARSYVA